MVQASWCHRWSQCLWHQHPASACLVLAPAAQLLIPLPASVHEKQGKMTHTPVTCYPCKKPRWSSWSLDLTWASLDYRAHLGSNCTEKGFIHSFSLHPFHLWCSASQIHKFVHLPFLEKKVTSEHDTLNLNICCNMLIGKHESCKYYCVHFTGYSKPNWF